MYKISDNKAPYFHEIALVNYSANSQRIIRSSVDYFCRWADATVSTDTVLSIDYLDNLLDLYHSHLFALNISKTNLVTKLKYAKLFVLWLQSTGSVRVKKPNIPMLSSRMKGNQVFGEIKYLYYIVVLLFFCVFLYLFYLIAPKLLNSLSTRDKYYVINSTKSIRIQLNPTSFVLSSNSLKNSSFEFKFVRDAMSSETLIIYCPISYLSMELNNNIITIPLSSCSSKNSNASTELIDFNGHVDVYIDGQFAARKTLI